jgi:hypothetical protein
MNMYAQKIRIIIIINYEHVCVAETCAKHEKRVPNKVAFGYV